MQCWEGQHKFAEWALGQSHEELSSSICGTGAKQLLHAWAFVILSEIGEMLSSGVLFFFFF